MHGSGGLDPAKNLVVEEVVGETEKGNVVREPDALYQKGKFSGRAVGVEVDEAGREVRFDRLENTDDLLLPDEFEFQKFNLIVRKVAHATKVAAESPQKGRILRGVVAEILSYREHRDGPIED